MFKNLFGKQQATTLESTGPADFPALETAAELLTAPSAMLQLSLAEARVVARYMRPRFIREARSSFVKAMLRAPVSWCWFWTAK